jgi:hypothetical protein
LATRPELLLVGLALTSESLLCLLEDLAAVEVEERLDIVFDTMIKTNVGSGLGG